MDKTPKWWNGKFARLLVSQQSLGRPKYLRLGLISETRSAVVKIEEMIGRNAWRISWDIIEVFSHGRFSMKTEMLRRAFGLLSPEELQKEITGSDLQFIVQFEGAEDGSPHNFIRCGKYLNLTSPESVLHCSIYITSEIRDRVDQLTQPS